MKPSVTPVSRYLEDTWRNLLFPDSTDIPSSLVERIPCLHDGTRNGLYNLLLDLVKQSRESIIQMIELNNALFREGKNNNCYSPDTNTDRPYRSTSVRRILGRPRPMAQSSFRSHGLAEPVQHVLPQFTPNTAVHEPNFQEFRFTSSGESVRRNSKKFLLLEGPLCSHAGVLPERN